MRVFRFIITTAFLAIFFTSCSSTSTLTMGVLEPARINVPNDVVKVGLINRSLPSEGNKTVDKIDKILSLEGLNLDKEGARPRSQVCMMNLRP